MQTSLGSQRRSNGIPDRNVSVLSVHLAQMKFFAHVCVQFSPGADVGFYKGGCPIDVKGAPEVERRRRQGGWGLGDPSPENFCISYIKMVSFYAFPVIFIDTVTVCSFQKRAPESKGPVSVHPEHPWIRPCSLKCSALVAGLHDPKFTTYMLYCHENLS